MPYAPVTNTTERAGTHIDVPNDARDGIESA